MWHVLKLDYTAASAAQMKTKLTGYSSLQAVQDIFEHLQLGYQLNATVRVKSGKTIKIEGVQIFESFKQHLDDALEAVKAGDATLMQEAKGLDLEIPD